MKAVHDILRKWTNHFVFLYFRDSAPVAEEEEEEDADSDSDDLPAAFEVKSSAGKLEFSI